MTITDEIIFEKVIIAIGRFQSNIGHNNYSNFLIKYWFYNYLFVFKLRFTNTNFPQTDSFFGM